MTVRAGSAATVQEGFAPFEVLRASSTSTRDGGVVVTTWRFDLQCLEAQCTPGPGKRSISLGSSRVRVGSQSVVARFPAVLVEPRATQKQVADPDRYFLHPTTPPPATFRFAPSTVRRALVAAAAVLVLLAAALLAPFVRRSRARAPAAQVDPLERALALVRTARTRPPPDRRRALGLLSRTLRSRGERTDGQTAADLAWSEPEPEPARMTQLVRAHRGAIVTSQIPLADSAELAPAWRRTRAVRVALAVALVLLVIVTALLASRPTSHPLRFLPKASNGIVVLDLSASISSDTFNRIGQTLDELASTNGRFGLVAFSDVAYEALPPGTPSSALLPYARYFKAPNQPTTGLAAAFPVNPWTDSFSAGTRISAGLGLALQLIRTNHLTRPGVILISDLDDDPGDAVALESIVEGYRRLGVSVKVVALNAAPTDQQRFQRLLGKAAQITQAQLPGDRVAATGASFPVAMAVLAVVIALALAANELFSARLTWRPGT